MTHYSSIARTFLLCLTTTLCATSAFAAKQGGLGFSHNDWELACDNTRTCRAAGYSIEGEELPVSVLLTRKAGAGQPVKATLQIGQYGDNEALDKLPSSFSVTMRINQQTLGTLPLGKDKLQADLSAAQTDALIAALSHTSDITWSYGKTRWQLSDKGAAAILLKMDEFQGRIGTTGALLKKGKQNEDKVLPSLPPPVIVAPALPAARSSDTKLASSPALHAALRATIKDNCPDASAQDQADFSIARLSADKILVSVTCWTAAYNQGTAFFVVGDRSPYHAELVTTDGSDYDKGVISSGQKGRGLGDCWSFESLTWNGKQFVQSASSSTGMCRLIAPGGAWDLPDFVTEVRHAAQ